MKQSILPFLLAGTALLVTILSAFLASAVEFVEAVTIVLAVGVTRQWRSALIGVAAAIATLAILIAIFGSALTPTWCITRSKPAP